jgi:carboxyl-terminal processing protease
MWVFTIPSKANFPDVMRGLLFFFIGLVVTVRIPCAEAQMSPQARKYLQEALDTIREHALYPQQIKWKLLDQQSFAKAEGAQSEADTYPAIIYACAKLHGRENCSFRWPDSTPDDARGRAEDAKKANPPPPRVRMSLAPSPFVERREPQLSVLKGPKEKRWAYLVVPSCHAPYTDQARNEPYLAAWANTLRSFLVEADSVNGWIVDLRGNGCCNMWAPIAALGPLLGEGLLGFFVDKRGRKDWYYEDGEAGTRTTLLGESAGKVVARRIDGPRLDLGKSPVAVLFDNATSGSGEQIAIAFEGRAKTRTFGMATKGDAGCCVSRRLSDGAFLDMDFGVSGDRRGQTYPEGLKPDERVELRGPTDLTSDPVVGAATKWLGTVR